MSRPSICLGYKSALEVARAVKPDDLTMAKGGGRMLPDSAPSSTELRSVLERLEANHPGLHLERPVHLVVHNVSNYRGTELGKFHACTKAFSGKSLLRLNDVLVSTPELALVQAATQEKNLVALLELGWELCGSYRTARTSLQPAYQVEPLTTTKALRDFVSRNASLDGAGKVARILPYFADGSASPRETKLALILGLPMMHGGQGLGIPSMNHEVPANGAAWAISHRKSFRCDACWPEAKLDVEYQSKENHEGENSRIRDSRRANAPRCHGLDRRRRDQRRTRQPCRHGRDRRWPSPTFREAEANAHPRSSCTQAEAPEVPWPASGLRISGPFRERRRVGGGAGARRQGCAGIGRGSRGPKTRAHEGEPGRASLHSCRFLTCARSQIVVASKGKQGNTSKTPGQIWDDIKAAWLNALSAPFEMQESVLLWKVAACRKALGGLALGGRGQPPAARREGASERRAGRAYARSSARVVPNSRPEPAAGTMSSVPAVQPAAYRPGMGLPSASSTSMRSLTVRPPRLL